MSKKRLRRAGMADVLRKVVLIVLFLFAGLPAAVMANSADAFFDTTLGDFTAELTSARQQGKIGVLLMFETEACPFCRRMRENVLNQTEVQQLFRKHFNIYAVDLVGSLEVTDFAGREQTEKAFGRSLRVAGTPTFLFVGLDGKELVRYTGATRDVAEFMALGRYVIEGRYRDMSFEQYFPDARKARKSP
jgi:thioredoxin-related protein